MAYIPNKNTSVSGTVGASVIGLPYFGVAGSVATVGTAVANQSVSGTVNVGGSVVAFQSDPTKLLTHSSVSGNVNVAGSIASWPFGNQSVSGTIGASIIGAPYFGIFGSVATVGTAAANQSVSGQVDAFIVGGSITTVGGSTGNSSVQLLGIPSISGTVRVVQQTDPWKVDLDKIAGASAAVGGGTEATALRVTIASDSTGPGSVAARQLGTWGASVLLTPGNNAIGSVATLQGTNPWLIGNSSVQVVNNITLANPNSSVQVLNGSSSVYLQAGSAAIGSVAVLQGTSPWLITGSVMNAMTRGVASVYLQAGVNAIGSVATLQGTNPWVTNIVQGNSSVQLISTSASIRATSPAEFAGNFAWTQSNSIVATGGLRNDTLASITAADRTYSPFAVGPSGETIVANAPITKWISAVTSVMAGPSVLCFAAPGASIFNYVSGVQITNPGTVAAHIAFSEGLGAVPASIMFFGIAPAGGGSNMVFPNPIKTTLANKNISASVSAHSSVYIMMEGFTAQQLT
jgi:hypothetical protein